MTSCWLLTAVLTAANAAPEPIPLTLVAAAEPVPALRYRLMPELREQSPGNAATGYYRAFTPEWQAYRKDAKKLEELLEKASTLSPQQLQGSDTAKQLEWLRTAPVLREVERAARRSYCDWDLTDRIREDGINLLLADVQELRSIARLVATRARLEMADRQFDAAARSLATGYAMAHHVGEGPTLIHGLIGIAVASVMSKQVEAWVQTPGSPNLYWSLTDLRQPFIDLRKPLQGERIWIDNILPELREHLRDPSRPPLSAAAMRDMARRFARSTGIMPDEAEVFGTFLAAAKYGSAKTFLAGHGWTAAQIEAMPALQAVFLHELYEYDRYFDVMARAVSLPYVEGHREMQKNETAFIREVGGPPFSVPIMAKMLLPAITKVALSRVTLDRRIAALRTVEAIRLSAAATGQLPDTLDAVTAVPLPLDPGTGKPFLYTRTGVTAILASVALPGESPSQGTHFRITLAK